MSKAMLLTYFNLLNTPQKVMFIFFILSLAIYFYGAIRAVIDEDTGEKFARGLSVLVGFSIYIVCEQNELTYSELLLSIRTGIDIDYIIWINNFSAFLIGAIVSFITVKTMESDNDKAIRIALIMGVFISMQNASLMIHMVSQKIVVSENFIPNTMYTIGVAISFILTYKSNKAYY